MCARALSYFFAVLVLLLIRTVAAQTPTNCLANAAWFTNPSFPTEVENGLKADNCDFHQMAWQAFAYLIQPANEGALAFETWMPEYGVFVDAQTSVTPWGQQPPAPCKAADAATSRKLFLRPRVLKGLGFDPDSDHQATGDPLYDQRQNVVYYSIWINKVEYDFITQCNFNDSTCTTAAPARSAIPSGAVELKASWRVFQSGAVPDDMYTIQGVVGATCKPVALGLVGFHLVMNTPLHPEFVWATFEHKRNAPECARPQVEPLEGWSFNDSKCSATACPPNRTNINPTQVCRVAPQGGGSQENVDNIKSINESVHGLLTKLVTGTTAYGGLAVWLNYEMTGNLWTVNGALPPMTGNEAGSLLNANTTLETFIQGSGNNCFTCHTQAQFVSKGVPRSFPNGAPANFSHLWGFAKRAGGCNNGRGPLPPSCPLAAPPRMTGTGTGRP